MNIKNTPEYMTVADELLDLAKTDAAQALKDEAVKKIIAAAQKVPQKYQAEITKSKAKAGTLQGAATVLISGLIYKGTSAAFGDVSGFSGVLPEILAGVSAAIAGAVYASVTAAAKNWWKHSGYSD